MLFGKSSNGTTPISVTISNGSFSGVAFSDVSTGTTSTASGTASATLTAGVLNTPSAGMFPLSLTTTGGTNTYRCFADINANSSGKNLIVCAGREGAGTTFSSFLLVSR